MSTKKTSKPSSHTPDSLQKLADTGTKEALSEISAFMKEATDPDKVEYARMCMSDCADRYYSPTNAEEEHQWMIRTMMHEHEVILMDLLIDQDDLQTEVEVLTAEKEISSAICAASPKKASKWKNFTCDDLLTEVQGDLEQMLNEIEYESAWIAQAATLITVERYQDIPPEHLSLLFPVNSDECACDECADKDDECDCDECVSGSQ